MMAIPGSYLDLQLWLRYHFFILIWGSGHWTDKLDIDLKIFLYLKITISVFYFSIIVCYDKEINLC